MKSILFYSPLTFLLTFLIAVNGHSESNYCIALRGNGELKPAHWGSIAKTIETFGIPQGMAGGSSASITTFLVESILMNPQLTPENNMSREEKNKRSIEAAFLVKSFEGYVNAFTSEPKYQAFFDFLIGIQGQGSQDSLLARLEKWIGNQTFKDTLSSINKIREVLSDAKKSEVFYGKQVENYHKALLQRKSISIGNLKIQMGEFASAFSNLIFNGNGKSDLELQFERLKSSLSVFGKLNAQGDIPLFVREGIVNFPALARMFSHMADFYSQRGVDDPNFKLFLNQCAPSALGLTWSEFIQDHPECQTTLNALVHKYHNLKKESADKSTRMNDLVGKYLPSLISTSVVIGKSRDSIIKIKSNYDQFISDQYDFSVSSEDLKFGYWGQSQDLLAVQNYFSENPNAEISRIDKSKRFYSLGESTWEKVLGISPAEPGLSSMIKFKVGTDEIVSLGGWSDLHPIPVLKAMGCEKVIYVTRRGGEALFAQGVAKRLLKTDKIPWNELDSSKENLLMTTVKNNRGRNVVDSDPVWSKMFNLADPESSFSVSLQEADAVVCTNWNRFDIKSDFRPLIVESYKAPIYLNHFISRLSLIPEIREIHQADNKLIAPLWISEVPADDFILKSFPKYSGCIPNSMSQ